MIKKVEHITHSINFGLSARNSIPQLTVTLSGKNWTSSKVSFLLKDPEGKGRDRFLNELEKAINRPLLLAIRNQQVANQKEFDKSLSTLENLATKFGSSLPLAVSLAAARAGAEGEAFYLYIKRMLNEPDLTSIVIPNLNFKIAITNSPKCLIREIMIEPVRNGEYFEDSYKIRGIFQALEVISNPNGTTRGFDSSIPVELSVKSDIESLEMIVEAFTLAEEGVRDFRFSVTIKDGTSPAELKPALHQWKVNFPITKVHFCKGNYSLSDWRIFGQTLVPDLASVCLDYTFTNLEVLKNELDSKPANTALIPISEFKTLTELLECLSIVQKMGVKCIISDCGVPPSEGELLVDLAVALDCDLKISDSRSTVFTSIGWVSAHAKQLSLKTRRG